MEVDKRKEYNLIIYDDDVHSYQYFLNAIKTAFPSFSDQAIRCKCALINKAGSAVCTRGCIERLEMTKLSLESLNLKCVIERRIT